MRVSTRNRRTNEEDGKAVGHRILLPICQSCVTSIARLTSAGAGTTRLTSVMFRDPAFSNLLQPPNE
jgi:hypothetical protein